MPLPSGLLSRLQRTQQPLCLRLTPLYASFHSSIVRNADTIPNHYETLELQPNASPADIKRQFFSLSKLHHPDHNPSDPTASTRFVQISEAYHTLSSPQKKASYDRVLHAQLHPSQRHPSGSHSSHTAATAAGYAGSRPPSGLSRRRAQFRGPPPSFFKSGGYGAQGAKRAAGASHAYDDGRGASDSAGSAGGFGPGQAPYQERGFNNDVPHFDRQSHRRTQESVAQRFVRRQREGTHFADDFARSRGGLLFNFILVGGAVVLIIMSRNLFADDEGKGKKSMEGVGGGK
ncbi:DnaJ-domain-containing protein [Glonium stellatum]|uniref:DnaJ-domain-containing protein n=1 Tax=Glonium stellatum TaxID=574774 RepID=A0A8E2JV73_9PEZI|nr:DnaJ-domain-containing protein [Glonium stellatum]